MSNSLWLIHPSQMAECILRGRTCSEPALPAHSRLAVEHAAALTVLHCPLLLPLIVTPKWAVAMSIWKLPIPWFLLGLQLRNSNVQSALAGALQSYRSIPADAEYWREG